MYPKNLITCQDRKWSQPEGRDGVLRAARRKNLCKNPRRRYNGISVASNFLVALLNGL